jgi:hypothetical protein
MDVRVIQAEEDQVAAQQAPASLNVEIEDQEWDGKAEAKAAGLPSGSSLNRDGTVDLTLRYPFHVAIGSTTTPYETVHFGRLKGKHMKDLAKSSPDDFLPRAVSHATGLSQARADFVLGEMDAVDQAAAVKVISFLSGAGDRTGR